MGEVIHCVFFFQAEDGIRDYKVTGVQTCALPIFSIYSDGRAVVRRTLPQALAKGRNGLTLELDGVDPAVVFSPDTAVTVASAVLRPATGRGGALESAVGATLSFVRAKGDTVRATVV